MGSANAKILSKLQLLDNNVHFALIMVAVEFFYASIMPRGESLQVNHQPHEAYTHNSQFILCQWNWEQTIDQVMEDTDQQDSGKN